jgi:hypothetical protein
MMALLPAARIISNSSKTQRAGYRKLPPKVDLAIENHITRVAKASPDGETESFFVADLGQVTRQQTRWVQNLPNVRPYYGILLLPHELHSSVTR